MLPKILDLIAYFICYVDIGFQFGHLCLKGFKLFLLVKFMFKIVHAANKFADPDNLGEFNLKVLDKINLKFNKKKLDEINSKFNEKDELILTSIM
jgi:hypothetical protein